jgi:hypothetical protein
MPKIVDMRIRRETGLDQSPGPRIGKVAAAQLATLDFHEDEAFWPWSGERLQVADPVGDDQLGQHHLADTRLGLWLAFTSRSSS